MPASKDMRSDRRARRQGRLERGHRDEQAGRDDRGHDGQLDARNVHRTGVPVRIDSMTSMIAWVDVVESTPEMSESCVAAAMTR